MSENPIRSAMKNICLDDEAKRRIKNLCYEQKNGEDERRSAFGARVALRIAVITAVIAALSVSVLAASKFISFSMIREGDEAKLNASLPNENKDTEAPLRAWNSGEGEISIRLSFEYMPEDMSEDLTATHKYRGSEINRAITFSGYDLRRSDLNTIIENIDSAEKFMAGENEAYLFIENSVSVYNKDLYVLFEEDELVVYARVGYGISANEIKKIAAGMSITRTEDVNIALPIANEANSENVPDIPFVIVDEEDPVYRSDLLEIGETGAYEDFFDTASVKFESFEILENTDTLDKNSMYDDIKWEHSVDENGNLVPFNRTEVVYSGNILKGEPLVSTFGETVVMTKKLICITVSAESTSEIRPFLNTFSLAGLEINDKGEVLPMHGAQNFVVDRIPGAHASDSEIVYFEDLGEGKYRLGYLIDADECEGELYFYSYFADIYYAFNP